MALCGIAADRDGGVLSDVAGHHNCGVCGEAPPAYGCVGGLPGPYCLGRTAVASPGCARHSNVLRSVLCFLASQSAMHGSALI